jgi:hypothetical protein
MRPYPKNGHSLFLTALASVGGGWWQPTWIYLLKSIKAWITECTELTQRKQEATACWLRFHAEKAN